MADKVYASTTDYSAAGTIAGTETLLLDQSSATVYATLGTLGGYFANPVSDDGDSLGTTSLKWSDLFLASGGVINWNNGDVTATHSSNALAFAGASSGYSFDAVVRPASSDGAALGSSSVMWSDLFLASGAVINFNNGNLTLTHSSGLLTTNLPMSCSRGGTENEMWGNLAGNGRTTFVQCTLFGYGAGRYITTGNANVAIGDQCLGGATVTGAGNVAIGYFAGYNVTSASHNFALGNQALYSASTGEKNVAIGGLCLYSCTGEGCVGLGFQAGYNHGSSLYAVYIGNFAGYNRPSGERNVFIGVFAGYGSGTLANNTGTGAVGIGYQALYTLSTGTNNVGVGQFTGDTITTGSNNTCIGHNADVSSSSATNAIALGSGAVAASGEFAINTSTTTIRFDDRTLRAGTATGLSIGNSITEKIGMYGVTPIVQRAEAAQAAVATTAATNVAPYGFTTAAQADAIVTLVNELRAALVALGAIKGAA